MTTRRRANKFLSTISKVDRATLLANLANNSLVISLKKKFKLNSKIQRV